MCGIVGIVGVDPRSRVDEGRLTLMRDALRHRGPDGEGLFVHGSAGLGHRRLAIVDVAGGVQPMSNEDGTIWIVFNGEIYNHLELRGRLEALGHVYRTRSDTETILHLYEEDGDACVEGLRGMFAFALWDVPRRRLLLARDRLGIKPLYYAWDGRELLFASEIKAILAAGPLRAEFNRSVLPEYLAQRFVAGGETFFRGVRKLLPGRVLAWSERDGLEERRYWRPPVPADGSPADLAARAEELRERLAAVVRSHLMGDVPVGLFLSGGIDSTALAALMAPALAEPVRTFAVGFDEPGTSELEWARLAARSVGAVHREVVVSGRACFDALTRLVWHEDEPIAFTSSVPLYFVSRLAAEDVKVVLTGEGSDELFLGYSRYRLAVWNQRLGAAWRHGAPESVRRATAAAVRALPAPARRWADRSFLTVPPDPRSLLFESFAVFPEDMRRAIVLDADLLARADPWAESLRLFEEAGARALDGMAHADLQTYLVELLMKQDQMSMAASVESRVPFLDHELVEHAAALPGNLKLRGLRTKAVLRRAVRDLVPPAILGRRKMGFPVPVGRWLRGPFRSVVREYVLGPRALGRGLFAPGPLARLAAEHDRGRVSHADRLWLLVNLEIWHRIFIDGEIPLESGGYDHA